MPRSRLHPASGPRANGLPLSAVALLLLTGATNLEASNGTIYYNRILTPASPALLRRIDGDGTADQGIPVSLPSALNPVASRNGQRLLVTSGDPGRPFKMSANVYVIDFLTGTLDRATSYQDEVVVDGVLFNPDLGQLAGNQISSYKVHFPYHKAFSPEGTRVVVMNIVKVGSATPAFLAEDVQASSGRFPVTDVYNLADALPVGPYVYMSPQERDGFNQGGDGVDWHPALNEVVMAVASDIPAGGNSGRSSMEGTVLAVLSATSLSPFVRKLTNPVGQADALVGPTEVISTAVAPHDYAPAISPDGTRVAYVRHFLRQDSRYDGAGIAPLPAICSIRIINYDGTGDREILRLDEGLWVSKLAWSPTGTQIAFDLAPQMVLNGWNSLLGDVTRSSIIVVNGDGTNPRTLVAAPSSYPSWAPESPAPLTRPTVRLRRTGDTFGLQIDQLIPGATFVVEGATTLSNWGSLGTFTAAGTTHFITITPNPNASFALYRVRL